MMTNKSRSLWTLALVAGFAVLAPARVYASVGVAADAEWGGDESDKLFNSEKVLRLSVGLGQAELESLRKEPRKYVKCSMKVGDVAYEDVGIHVKGGVGSFRPIDGKPALTLNLKKFKKGQRFHGLSKFHLSNSVQDPTYLSEFIGGQLFRAAGVPASRITHVVVTVNGKQRGLYYLKEGYDSQFLKWHFKNDRGNLYDGGYLTDLNAPLQLLSGKKDVKDRADLKALWEAAHEKDLAVRFQRLNKLLDMDRFISYLAMEIITFDWDSYPISRNNYRVYHDPDKDKITFFPSGMDQILRPNSPSWLFPVAPWGFQGAVARKLMETPEGKKRYVARVRALMQATYRPDALCKRVDEMAARIQVVLADVDPAAAKRYAKDIEDLRFGIRLRAKQMDEQLRKVP
jgi:spore coat protein CotH